MIIKLLKKTVIHLSRISDVSNHANSTVEYGPKLMGNHSSLAWTSWKYRYTW